jgi:hypothetical protein
MEIGRHTRSLPLLQKILEVLRRFNCAVKGRIVVGDFQDVRFLSRKAIRVALARLAYLAPRQNLENCGSEYKKMNAEI